MREKLVKGIAIFIIIVNLASNHVGVLGEIKEGYTKENTTIRNSYLLTENELNEEIQKIIESRNELELPVTRTIESYKSEIRVHNRLYNLGILTSHTKDADLEENINKWKELIYFILGAWNV